MNHRLTLQTSSCILVPEVNGSIRSGSGECAVHRMEGDVIYGVDHDLIFRIWCLLSSVAFEREI